MAAALPPDPTPIVQDVKKFQDAEDAERESRMQRQKRKDEIEQGVSATNQPKTSGS